MGLSAVTYALSKKYTEDSLIGIGALKGAPCKIKSIIKENGENIITFEWLDNDFNRRRLGFERGYPCLCCLVNS